MYNLILQKLRSNYLTKLKTRSKDNYLFGHLGRRHGSCVIHKYAVMFGQNGYFKNYALRKAYHAIF